jgi:hypothetical protein
MSLKRLGMIHAGTHDPLHDIGLGDYSVVCSLPKTCLSLSSSARSPALLV